MSESFFSVNEEICNFLDDLDELPREATDSWWNNNAARIAEKASCSEVREIALRFLRGELDGWDAHCIAIAQIHSNRDGEMPSKDEVFLDEEDAFFAEEAKNFVMGELDFLHSLAGLVPNLKPVLNQKVGNTFYDKIDWVQGIGGILSKYVHLQLN